MAGTPRSAKVREALEARAKAMRREGASMAEIERETGVPAPTLHQWAARGKWRLCDLEEDSFLSSGTSVPSVLAARGQAPLAAGGCSPFERSALGESGMASHSASELSTPDPQGPQGRPPARSEGELVSPGARNRPTGGEGGQERLAEPTRHPSLHPTPENLLALAQTAKAEAMRLYRLGRVKPAREHLLTAQRFVAAAGGGGAAQAEPSDGGAARAELERRLLRLYPSELAKYLRAIEAGEVAAYLAERETGAERWREPFWWPDLIKARLQYPPHGFREDAPEDADCGDDAGELPFLNACLILLCTRPDWRVMLEGH